MNISEVKELLMESDSIFAKLGSAELDSLLALGQPRSIPAKERVCHKDTPGIEFFIIASGKLKVSSQSDDGREAIHAILADGDVFGEMSVIDGQPRSTDVAAIQDSEVLVIHHRDFLPFLQNHPSVAIGLLVEFSKRLRRADARLEDMRFLDVRTRLAKTLHQLANEHGRTTSAGGIRLDIRLSQEELGNLVAATRESVNKQLRLWEADGVLTASQTGLLIHRPNELKILSGVN